MKSSIETVKTILIGILLAVIILISVDRQAEAGIASFKTALISAFTGNFTAPQRLRVTNAYVSANQAEWNAIVASGTADNATNRGSFAADKIIEQIQFTVVNEEHRAAVQSVPTPSPIEQE